MDSPRQPHRPKRLGEEVSVAGATTRWIWPAIVRLPEGPADSLPSPWFVGEAQQNMHVSMRRGLTASGKTIPANVEAVRTVPLVEHRASSSEKLECLRHLFGGQIEDGRTMSARNDHTAAA